MIEQTKADAARALEGSANDGSAPGVAPLASGSAAWLTNDLVMAWAKNHCESFFGPTGKWTATEWDTFHRDLGMLVAFASDMRDRFNPAPQQLCLPNTKAD